MPYLENSQGLLAKAEATQGVSSDPADRLNAFTNPTLNENRIRDLSFSPDIQTDDNNTLFNGAFVKDLKTITKRLGSVSFSMKYAPATVEDNGDGTYTHTNPYGKYLTTAGFEETVIYDTVATSADISNYQYGAKYLYRPTINKAVDSLTLDVIERDPNPSVDGQYAEIVGAIGNISINADTTGEPFMMQAEYMGALEDMYAIPAAKVPNLQFDPSQLVKSAADKYLNTHVTIRDLATDTLIIDGICTKGLSINTGVEHELRECQEGNSGAIGYFIGDMNPTLAFSIELPELNTWDWYEALTNEKLYEITITSKYQDENGAETLTYVFPAAQMTSAPIETDGRIRRLNTTWDLLGNEDLRFPAISYTNVDGTSAAFDDSTISNFDKYQSSMYMIFEEVPYKFTPSPV